MTRDPDVPAGGIGADADGTDADDADALAAVADSALERALVDETDSRRYFALAGAVVRAREGGDAESDPLAAALVCTVAVSALESVPPEPTWSPPDARTELVAAGAVRATRRFDADADRVAARAGLPLSDLRARLENERRGDHR